MIIIFFAIIIIYSLNTYQRNHVWKDDLNLWKDVSKKSPNKPRMHNYLGVAYGRKGIFDEAITECKKALAINPHYAEAHCNLGVAYGIKGRLDEAMVEFERALVIKPHYAEAHNNLALGYLTKGLSSLAADHLYKAGLFHLEQGNMDNALKAYKDLKRTKSEELAQALYKKLYSELK